MPEHAVKCWIIIGDGDGADDVEFSPWEDEDIPAIAVPLDLLERLLCVVADMEVTDEERDHLERLCREMREEVGNG